MPTYQYACTACEHRFDAVQAFTDSALTECPECTGRLRKLYSSVGVVFKGSGFYRNDSRSGAKSASSSGGSSSESSSTAKDSKDSSSSSSTAKESGSTSSTSSPAKDSGGSPSSSSSTSSTAAKAS